MQRLIRLSLFSILLGILSIGVGFAQNKSTAFVSGSIKPSDVRIFQKDTIYIINNDYVVGGTLIIEPGTEIHFQANGRLIDSTGGRIIADGFAKATYTSNPGVNPVLLYEPLGYASFDYFFYNAVDQYNDNNSSARTVRIGTTKEPTVHNDKYNHIFNVLLDKSTRQIVNLVDPTAYPKERNSVSSTNPNHVVVSYEQALLFHTARLNNDPENFDPNLKTLPWKRIGGINAELVDITPEPITFIGKPAGNFSREWGHIIVLPGSRSAFFRNVVFKDIRKDTTVDRQSIYKLAGSNYVALNARLNKLTNGAGGAITTLSSRTWIIDAKFINNMARNRGGALNILQAPQEFEMFRGTYTANSLGYYPNDKNPNLTNKDGSPSIVNTQVLRIDNIDESLNAFPEPLTDQYRQAFDDARTAVLLGRVRRLHFDGNYVQLAHTEISPLKTFDDTTRAEVYPYSNGNHALGGAIYISGVIEYKERLIEVGLGVNNSIKTAAGEISLGQDTLLMEGNEARNFQNSPDSEGARGGAIYIGNYTSLIAAGQFRNNSTKAKYFDDINTYGEKVFFYSQGGAIYHENTLGRLQLRGGPARENVNPTYFTGNTAGGGGAIYIDGNTSNWESPVIGGSDQTLTTRDYGFDIKFENNYALTFGGAIHTKRNFSINGAGGVAEDLELGYDGKYSVRFWNNKAAFAGGAIDIRIPSAIPPLPPFKRAVQIVRAEFINNTVGEDVAVRNLTEIRGGGAIYSYNGDVRLVKGTDFINNTVYHGNGGALSIVNLQDANAKKFFLSDLDLVSRDADGMPVSYTSVDGVFTGENEAYPADVRMLTRFLNNKILNPNTEWFESQLGNGATMDGIFVNRRNKDTKLPENGIGLGGAIYILDSVSITKASRLDSMNYNRVRIQNNESFTGSALYSDNYNLKLIFNRSLITGNKATSTIGMEQNVITGPLQMDTDGKIYANRASSDLTATTIYGEIQGPLPSYIFSEAANSIFNNSARFLIRLPDAPNTKGLKAGTTGIGYGGTDTLRGNYWGQTEANVNFTLPHLQDNPGLNNIETFFVAGDGNNWLPMIYPELINDNPADPRNKGPFESLERQDITYRPIVQKNVVGDENTPDAISIPEKLLMVGHIYDIYDKSTDIKTADYSKRRMSPIEDFSVGIPPKLRLFNDATQPSYSKVVKRWVRDPYYAELRDNGGNFVYPGLAAVQTEFRPDEKGVNYHPIGYPVFLETNVNYDGLTRTSNHDPLTKNETVFFVVNLKTGDYIRANLTQVDENAPYREVFRKTIELVPDSTRRTDPTWRRTSEGLANLGSGPELLANLFQNPKNEDLGTLQGRRYSEESTLLARVSNLYSNRPNMPVSNNIGTKNYETYYAGERYNALPVRVGDSVLIVSRTILWREGIHNAATKGIAFRITESTRPPVWTGNIVHIQTDTVKNLLPSEEDPNTKVEVIYTEFLNKVFLTEDRSYPVAFRTYSGLDRYGDPSGEMAGGQGRDSIITITAIDSNRFYDPRSFLEPTGYARLEYSWKTYDNSALGRWLVVNKKYAADPTVFGANGYLELAGLPINPFVVPGGDSITFYAKNYPPHYRNVDNLKAMIPALSQDEIDRWVETYPGYLANPVYDIDNARFLQQDTIDVGTNHQTEHTFKIFVVDSLPRFLEPGDDYTINRIDDPSLVYVDAKGTELTCGVDRSGKLIANLTDKLRFQIDVNTDDEWEDKSPAAQGWDFRYGRTAYGFMNIAIRQNPADTSVIDTLIYDRDQYGLEGAQLIQSRPIWMSSEYLTKYGTDDEVDMFATDFTTHGQLNIRIPADAALNLLKPINQYNSALNTDTSFIVIVNDGHGGINSRKYDIFINIVPTITNESLPDAREDQDYNPSLLDINRQINVTDPNFGQKHTYKLIYPSTTGNIPIDACYPEAGIIDITNIKTTPEWLRINSNTGMLYGMPKVKDAPKNEIITVVVTDENGLSAVKRIPLKVEGVQHDPHITGVPAIACIDQDTEYSTKITIVDTDLNRKDPSETVTLELVDENGLPINGLRITPSNFTGTGASDNFEATITKVGNLTATNGNWLVVNIVATDKYGNKDTINFRLTISQPTDFTASIRVENVKGSYQDLLFGTASVTGTSTGDGNDGDYVGKIDEDLCEYELPPRPYDDAFDARWTITNRNGVLRNIFPTARPSADSSKSFIYKGRFQAGGVTGGSSPLYPVTLTWTPSEIPAINDGTKNPAGSSWWLKDRFSDGNIFSINMRIPTKAAYNSQVTLDIVGDKATLTILDDGIDQFVIMHDWLSSVEELDFNASATRINSVAPNPISANSTIEFEVLQSSNVTLQVVDMLGNVITTLVNDDMRSGTYKIDWNAADVNGNKLANGQYMLRLVAGKAISTYPVVVVK